MSDETKQVAKMSPTEIEARKALIESDFTGYEDQTSGMLTMPFLKIAQTNTLAIDNRAEKSDVLEPGKIAGLRPGMYYNSQNGRVYGKKLNMIALYAKESYLHYGEGLGNFKAEYSGEEKEDLVKRGVLINNDGASGWHDSEGGKCFYAITFLVFLPDHPEDGILPLVVKSKGLKYAKNWNSLMLGMTVQIGKEKRKANRYHLVWKSEIKSDKNDQGSWYNIGNADGTGISFVGNIFDAKYAPILPALTEAVEVVRVMREKKQTVNYAADSRDEEIPTGGGNPFEEE